MSGRRVSNWVIIFVFTALGAVAAIFIEVVESMDVERVRYIPVPSMPVEIVGIDTSNWFQSDPYIRAADGKTYLYQEYRAWNVAEAEVEPAVPERCDERQVRFMESQAGPIVDCRQAQEEAEWCPGRAVSVAIADSGFVWKFSQREPCKFLIGLGMVYFVPAGLVLGLVLVLLHEIRLDVVRMRQRT